MNADKHIKVMDLINFGWSTFCMMAGKEIKASAKHGFSYLVSSSSPLVWSPGLCWEVIITDIQQIIIFGSMIKVIFKMKFNCLSSRAAKYIDLDHMKETY